MPAPLQLAAYVCGVRFSQARTLIDGPWPVHQADLRAAMVQLIRAFTELMNEMKIKTDRYELAKKLLNDCWTRVEEWHEPNIGSTYQFVLNCWQLLSFFFQDAVSILQSVDSNRKMLQEWFELGVEIAACNDDERRDPSTGVRLSVFNARWVHRNPQEVQMLTARLGVGQNDLMPEPDFNVKALFPDLYDFLVTPWSRIETGLCDLTDRRDEDRNSIPKSNRKKKLEARDEWMHEQYVVRSQTLGQILIDLREQHPEWPQITTEAGVSMALKRYVEGHPDALPLPDRKNQ